MTDRVLFDLADGWALGYDAHQWIVMQRRGKEWRSVSFVAGHKSLLGRIFHEKGSILPRRPTPLSDAFPRRSGHGWRNITKQRPPIRRSAG